MCKLSPTRSLWWLAQTSMLRGVQLSTPLQSRKKTFHGKWSTRALLALSRLPRISHNLGRVISSNLRIKRPAGTTPHHRMTAVGARRLLPPILLLLVNRILPQTGSRPQTTQDLLLLHLVAGITAPTLGARPLTSPVLRPLPRRQLSSSLRHPQLLGLLTPETGVLRPRLCKADRQAGVSNRQLLQFQPRARMGGTMLDRTHRLRVPIRVGARPALLSKHLKRRQAGVRRSKDSPGLNQLLSRKVITSHSKARLLITNKAHKRSSRRLLSLSLLSLRPLVGVIESDSC